jgi:hypothetical protein
MTNLIDSNKRDIDTQGNGYICFHLYRDRNGDLFPGGMKRYVVFHYDRLVGEYDTLREANIGYARGDMDGHRAEEYAGLNK